MNPIKPPLSRNSTARSNAESQTVATSDKPNTVVQDTLTRRTEPTVSPTAVPPQPSAPTYVLAPSAALQRTAHLPDAYAMWESIRARVQDKIIAIFLDYDGTLTPITDHPEEARLSAFGKEALVALQKRWPVYVVSGRGRSDVQGIIGMDNLVYAGSHGFDIGNGRGEPIKQVGTHLLGLMEAFVDTLTAQQAAATHPADIARAHFENKGLSVALHYRTAPQSQETLLAWGEALVQANADKVKLFHESGDNGKVIEIKGAQDWHKGKAVSWLLEQLACERGVAPETIVPFFFGDAHTDEDGFAAVRSGGYGVRVLDPAQQGLTHPDVLKNGQATTLASLTLSDPQSVHAFLLSLASLP